MINKFGLLIKNVFYFIFTANDESAGKIFNEVRKFFFQIQTKNIPSKTNCYRSHVYFSFKL